MGWRLSRFHTFLALIFGALTLVMIVMLGTSPLADAQISCDPEIDYYFVSTTAEVNEAISCHNQSEAANSSILLQNNIAADAVTQDAVFERVTQGRLLVTGIADPDAVVLPPGSLSRLSRGTAAGTAPLPLLAGGPDVLIMLSYGALELGPFDTFGIQSGQAFVGNSAIFSDSPHPDAVGVSTDGLGATIQVSLIRGIPTGVEAVGGSAPESFIDSATIASTETDIRFIGDGFWGIRNSTLGAPVGIVFGDGDLSVRSSTILGDAAVPAPSAGPNSFVTFESTIANSCTADEVTVAGQAGPAWNNGGNNVGACFTPGQIATMGQLADNGCIVPTPIGCPRTAAITETSTAFKAVAPCLSPSSDQRGAARPRSPAACDAGAFELGCDGSSPVDRSVADYEELRAALRCHSISSAGPSVISLQASITPGFDLPSVIGRSLLTLNGNGHTLRSDGSGDVLRIFDGDLSIRDLTIEVGSADTAGIDHQGGGNLMIERSAIVGPGAGSTAAGVITGPGVQEFSLIESIIQGTADGVRVASATNLIVGSTIESLAVDVVWDASSPLGGVFNSTLAGPLGIDVSQSGLIVENSTILNNALSMPMSAPDGTVVTFKSSIINGCALAPQLPIDALSGKGWVDIGGNVGDCVDAGVLVQPAVVDYPGCPDPTPIGCPRLAVINAASPAYQAGDCRTGRIGTNTVDQRREPRTPVDLGCDSGSFEAEPPVDGDVNLDESVDNGDVQAILDWLAGGDEPALLVVGDLDQSGATTLTDALALAQLIANG